MLADCHGTDSFALVPYDLASGHVPPAFSPAGALPFTASLDVEAFVCGRVTLPNATASNVAFLLTMMNVVPKNASWDKDDSSFFAYDFLATDATLVSALRQAGFAGALKAAYTRTATPDGSATGEVWEYDAGSVDYKVTFGAATQAQGDARQPKMHFWLGSNPYVRADARTTSQPAVPFLVEGGLVQVSGSSGFRAALGTDQAPLSADAVVNLKWDLAARPIMFKA